MKKFTLFFVISLFTFNSRAQVREMMLNKANEKLKQKQTEKASADTTSTNNSNNNSTDKQENTQPVVPGFNLTGVSKKELRSEYHFTENVVAEMRNYKKNGEPDGEPQQVKYHFGKETYIGMEMNTKDKKDKSSTVFTIAEFEKSITIMLTDDGESKTGFAMKYDYNKAVEESADTTKYKVAVTKTGRTKKILGYNCEEYIITSDKGEKTEAWYTSEIPLDLYKSMSAFARGQNTGMNGYPQGFMMEMIQYTTKGERSEWKVIAVNLNTPAKVVTSDYTFAGM